MIARDWKIRDWALVIVTFALMLFLFYVGGAFIDLAPWLYPPSQ